MVTISSEQFDDIVTVTLQETCEQRNSYSQFESASDPEVNNVNRDTENSVDRESKVSPGDINTRKRHLSSELQQSENYLKRLALWVTRTQFEELVSKQ